MVGEKMAAPRKKTTKKNQTKLRKKSTKRNSRQQEVISIVLIALSLLTMISVYTKSGVGMLGTIISSVVIGMLGFCGFILPIIVMIISIYALFDKEWLNCKRVFKLSILVFAVSSLAHIMSMDSSVKYDTFFDYLYENYKNGNALNGGLIGTILGNFFITILGKVGTYIALIVTSLVMIIISTDWSFFNFLKNTFSKLKNAVDDTLEYENDEDEFEEYEYEEDEDDYIKLNNVNDEVENKAYTIEIKRDENKDEKKKILLFNEEFQSSIRKPLMDTSTRNKNIMEVIKLEEVSNEVESSNEIEVELPNEVELATEVPVIEQIETPTEVPVIKQEEQIIHKENNVKSSNITHEETKSKAERVFSDKPIIYNYTMPPLDLLNKSPSNQGSNNRTQILENSRKLESTLKSFGVVAKVIEVSKGPTVTRYELAPGEGVKVSKISGLADDLALSLAAEGIRIEAPIPGKSAVGIEVPNKEVTPVFLREVIDDPIFRDFPSNLAFALGKDIAGKTVVADIAKMPHMLVAGATGSGKSVCINTLITSILYKTNPNEVKLLMIDPKVVELSIYNGIPHLLIPVVTDPKKASGALNWAVAEMIKRYNLFAETSVRDLKGYNQYLRENSNEEPLPQIVIIIDELADLMMAAPGEVEDAICRLAQMARAAGLYLIIATQRPSVDVITGLIKANIPSRLAFSVSSGTDSRTILDMIGAEKLLGKGDMLFYPVGMSKPLRVQGAFISDKEVESIVNFVKQGTEVIYDEEMINKITASKNTAVQSDEVDELFESAVQLIIKKEKASASMLQRQFKIGYNRASRLIEDLEARGVISEEDGSKPRKVLMDIYQWEQYKEETNL